jgi:hypothetical protein
MDNIHSKRLIALTENYNFFREKERGGGEGAFLSFNISVSIRV